jgi:thiol-disulfide isomerase/thioredoxin
VNKTIIVIIIGVLLAIGGGIFFLSTHKEPIKLEMSSSQQPSQSSTPANTSKSEVSANTESPGKYIDYSPTSIAETKGTKIIFFYAPWCPQCRALEADIKKTGLPNNVTVMKADYDTSQELKRKYGVTIQTTLVKIDDNGNLIKKYVAYNSPTVDALKGNLLEP